MFALYNQGMKKNKEKDKTKTVQSSIKTTEQSSAAESGESENVHDEETFSTTLFDDVFRTIVEEFPELLISLINEVFGTHYPQDVEIIQLRNEHMEPGGKIITDCVLMIEGRCFHAECQSTKDANMIIRMAAYDMAIALEHPRWLKEKEKSGAGRQENMCYRIRFPQSCVMYIRDDGSIPEELEMEIEFADGFVYRYHVPAVNVQKYTKEEIFEKQLFVFLPYYVLRYEAQIKEMEKQEDPDTEAARTVLEDLKDVCARLKEETDKKDKAVLYAGLTEMVQTVARYAFRKTGKKIRKGVEEAMGGKVLELQTLRSFREGRAEGKAEGEESKGKAVYRNCRRRGMSAEEAAAVADISDSLAKETEREWQQEEAFWG